jgi:short-subunit dehydrogenase
MSRTQRLYRDKSVLITGASSGIGAALAIELARFGAKTALFARRRNRLEEVANKVREAGGVALIVEGDVADLDSTKEAHARIVDAHGPIDVAFLNAGLGDSFRLAKFSSERIRKVMDVNFYGVVNWLELLLSPMLERQRGTLVGVSSLAGHRGNPFSHGYSASKAAVSTLMESVRLEAKPAGVNVSIVEPGFVHTEMTARLKFKPFAIDSDKAARIIASEVAAGREMIRFPWPTAAMVALQRHLPIPLYDLISSRMLPKNVSKDVRQ